MTNNEEVQEFLFFNGINGESGEYDLPPMTGEELSDFIQGVSPPENLNELRFRFEQSTQKHLGVKEGVDVKNLEEAGWGVIFASDADPAVKEALSELIHHREKQAGEHFRLYEGADGHRPEESKTKFLARHGAGPGPADPEKVPYYLLLVGSPERIPYRFQSQLDVQYAVGRIHFDTLDEYANYARSVVEAETKPLKLPRQVSLFGVANPNDRATEMSANNLIAPIRENLEAEMAGWTTSAITREEATKEQLSHLLGGDQTPALLFSASHGMSFPKGSARQLPHQGAILCQDWPGPQDWHQEIPQDFYFAGDDLSSNAKLLGLIAFFFACYGAGTPLLDEFAKQAFKNRAAIAEQAFIAQLPAKMLSHPRGGALAVIGHVERAWGYSFMWPKAGEQTGVFTSTVRRLLTGYPVGAAVEFFNERYAELSTVLSDELEEIEFGRLADPYALSGLWTANNDARGYAVIGDPAVRLPVASADETASERPTIVMQPFEVSTRATTEDGEEATVRFQTESGDDMVARSAILPASDADLKMVVVVTYLTTDMADPEVDTPAAVTHLKLDGNLETILTQEAATSDERVLALHQDMVRQAIDARLAYLELLAKSNPEEPQ